MHLLAEGGDGVDTAWHGCDEIELRTIVRADVGVRRPYQRAIDAAVPIVQVLQVAADSVAVALRLGLGRVVEEAIVWRLEQK